jgi:valyl-tRNA synthetase
MPFITEEIWQRIAPLTGKKGASIMLESYPRFDGKKVDQEACKELEWLKNVIVAIRSIRSEMNIAPGKWLSIILRKGSAFDIENIRKHEHLLSALAKIESISWIQTEQTPPPSATAFVGELEIFIPMADFINKEEELARLNKEIMKIQKDLTQIETKLQNPQFVDKAPAEVVAKERIRCDELRMTLAKLVKQMEEINALMPK